MKRHLKLYLCCIIGLTSLINCRHKCDASEEEEGCPGCCADQSLEGMKDYYYFKTGSYWIYEEVTSGERDTVMVFEDYEGNDGENDYWTWISYSSFYGYDFRYEYNESFSTYCLGRPSCHCRKVNRTKAKPGDGSGEDILFSYPNVIGNYNPATGGGVTSVIAIMDSLVVNEISYPNVVSWYSENCTTEDVNHWNWDDGTPAYFDISRNVGIVRKTLPEYNEVWNLIEYTSIQ